MMQALGLGLAWEVLKAQWVPKHVSEDTISLINEDAPQWKTPIFINQLSQNFSSYNAYK